MDKEDKGIEFYGPDLNISTACIKTQTTAGEDPHESDSYS